MKSASKILRRSFDPKRWRKKLIDRAFPVLAVGMARAAVGQLMSFGIDVRRKRGRKGIKGDVQGHEFHGNQWTGGGGGGTERLSGKERKTVLDWVDGNDKYDEMKGADERGERTKDLDTLIGAVSKCPSYSGPAFRGLNIYDKSVLKKLVDAKEITTYGMTSFSNDKDQAMMFGFSSAFPVVFVTSLKDGRDISKFGEAAGKHDAGEVVTRRSTFRVTKVEKKKEGVIKREVTYIHMEQQT